MSNNPASPLPPGYGGMILAMRRKDPELYEKISAMSVWSGVKAWREKYPEDMEGVVQSTPYDRVGPHLIKGI